MTTVETVRGPVDVEQLGPALMHEHIFILQPEALQNYGHVWGASYWDEEIRVADAIEKLRAVRAAGIETIVDPTAPGLGRFIPRIQRINAEVDINIVVATGVYAFLELPNFFGYRSPEAIAEFFVREIREGIDDTGVKAAFLKCAVERHGLIGDVPRILAAVAAAGVETGAPIMVHTNAAAQTGLPALEALTNEGVDPAQVIVMPTQATATTWTTSARSPTPGRSSVSTASTSRSSTRIRSASRPSPRSWPRGTPTGCISRTTPPASTTSWSATRTSPTSGPTISTSHGRSCPRCSMPA